MSATIPIAGDTEIDLAVASAKEAQREWISWPAERRRDALIGLADLVAQEFDEFARLTVNDYAPPISMAAGTMLTERYLRYYAGFVDKATGSSTPGVALPERERAEPHRARALRGGPGDPPLERTHGPGLGLAVAPALAAGNAVLVKPPELTPFAPYHFGQLCLRAGSRQDW